MARTILQSLLSSSAKFTAIVFASNSGLLLHIPSKVSIGNPSSSNTGVEQTFTPGGEQDIQFNSDSLELV